MPASFKVGTGTAGSSGGAIYAEGELTVDAIPNEAPVADQLVKNVASMAITSAGSM